MGPRLVFGGVCDQLQPIAIHEVCAILFELWLLLSNLVGSDSGCRDEGSRGRQSVCGAPQEDLRQSQPDVTEGSKATENPSKPKEKGIDVCSWGTGVAQYGAFTAQACTCPQTEETVCGSILRHQESWTGGV